MDKQFRLLTQRALGALGAVVRARSLAGNAQTIPIADLIAEMNMQLPGVSPLVAGQDYIIRNGVTHVRFSAREAATLDILLPEAQVLEGILSDMQNNSATVRLSWPYTNEEAPARRYYLGANGYGTAITSNRNGEYDAIIDQDGFAVFLDPYMGGYVTAQCI